MSVAPVKAVDFLGRLIKAGDTIVYPVRRGSRMWMQKLVIQSVQDTPKGPCVSGLNMAGRRICLYNLENCVVI